MVYEILVQGMQPSYIYKHVKCVFPIFSKLYKSSRYNMNSDNLPYRQQF